MVTYNFNSSTQEAEAKDFQFDINMGYMSKSLKTKQKEIFK